MKYTKEQILQVLEKYFPLIKIHKNIHYSGNVKDNVKLFKQIDCEYPGMFKGITEMIYLKNNGLDKRYCVCGNEKSFYSLEKGYFKYCSSKCSSNSLEFKEKYKNTLLKKYGVETLAETEFMKNKFKDPKWGKMCSEKALKTYKEKTGYDSPFKNSEIKEKTKQTNLKKYGVEHHWQSKDPKLNGQQTRLEKYGYANSFQFPWNVEKCNKAKATKAHKDKISKILKETAKEKFKKEHQHFEDYNEKFFKDNFIIDGKFDVKKCCEYFKISYHWALYKKRSFGITCSNTTGFNAFLIKQNEVYEYIKSIYKGEIRFNVRDIIKPLEINFSLDLKPR